MFTLKNLARTIFGKAASLVRAAEKYNRIVQHGTQIRSSSSIQEAIKGLHDGQIIGEVYLSRGLCFKWRDTIGHAARRRFQAASTMTSGPGRPPSSHSRATVFITTGTGSGIPATATWATKASIRWMLRAGG